MIYIPRREQKMLRQSNRSKILGDIWASFNLDLQSNLGVIRVSPRLRINTASVANQGRAIAFRDFDTKIFAVCGTKVFNSASHSLISAFTEDVSASAPTTNASYSDMEVFNALLCVTTQTALFSKVDNGSGGGAYTSRITFDSNSLPHKLCYFKKHNRLYYFDGNGTAEIRSVGTSSWTPATSGDYFLDTTLINTFARPSTMATDNNYIWIGTINRTATANLAGELAECSVLVWDGISNTVAAEYKIRATGVLALCKDESGTMHAIDTNGRLLKFNGGGFTEIDRLPLNRELLSLGSTDLFNSFIHPNGFILSRNGTFLILINGTINNVSSSLLETLSSGIWEWSKDTGFIHRQAFTYNTLADTTITDYGQGRISLPGALYEPNIATAVSSGKPTLICGATYNTDSLTTADAIFVDDPKDTIQKYGYFVTSWLTSANIKDTWQKIVLKYRQFLDSADSIKVKYRVRETPLITDFSITWTSTTSFTTLTDLSNYAIGDEVEVYLGIGSGLCSHITAITALANGYAVTIDETYTGATGTVRARFQKWTKFLTISNQITESTVSTIPNLTSERVQFKVCMLFTGEDEVFELGVVNKPSELY